MISNTKKFDSCNENDISFNMNMDILNQYSSLVKYIECSSFKTNDCIVELLVKELKERKKIEKNLIIFHVPDIENTKDAVKDLMIYLNEDYNSIVKIQRIKTHSKPNPILVEFCCIRHKIEVLVKAKNLKNYGKRISVQSDLTTIERDYFKFLNSKSKKENLSLVFDSETFNYKLV